MLWNKELHWLNLEIWGKITLLFECVLQYKKLGIPLFCYNIPNSRMYINIKHTRSIITFATFVDIWYNVISPGSCCLICRLYNHVLIDVPLYRQRRRLRIKWRSLKEHGLFCIRKQRKKENPRDPFLLFTL